MLAYHYKHPDGARANAFYFGKLIAATINPHINRDTYPDGLTPEMVVPWLNQETPEHLLTESEVAQKQERLNKEAADAILAAMEL